MQLRRCRKKTRSDCAPFIISCNDPRLLPSGAIVDEDGRLKDSAYRDLVDRFCRELPAERHPFPYSPGLAADEVQPEGLKVWNDAYVGKRLDGAGWIAANVLGKGGQDRAEERWFNVRTWGSWRLAFLLARLQRKVWECRAELTPLDYMAEDKVAVVDGIRMTPSALRNAAHAVASAIRSRAHALPTGYMLEGVDASSTAFCDGAIVGTTSVPVGLETPLSSGEGADVDVSPRTELAAQPRRGLKRRVRVLG
mmetsp:Transcript_38478/g.106025  ORF Transcript_38478/g.106025 Transcript_38478/m.106025 type:complete len:252 (+) Transcript_38478:103-858(+)